MLQRARAVMICPGVFKAGFILGGSGGDCVLLARAGNGTWSYPSFYTIGSGSIGFQAGIEDSSLMMTIMTSVGESGDGQPVQAGGGRLGGDRHGRRHAGWRDHRGGGGGHRGVRGDARIVRRRFGGGQPLSLLSTWNAAYYGEPYAARRSCCRRGGRSRANPLREVLTRYGTPSTMKVSVRPPVYGPNAQGGYPPPGQGYVAPAQGYPPPGQGDRAPPQGIRSRDNRAMPRPVLAMRPPIRRRTRTVVVRTKLRPVPTRAVSRCSCSRTRRYSSNRCRHRRGRGLGWIGRGKFGTLEVPQGGGVLSTSASTSNDNSNSTPTLRF